MKIAVYSIAKNEESFIKRFLGPIINEADGVFITDTGSTDNTIELARKYGAQVFETKVEPFDFGKARNIALSNVPEDYDFCICLDLDDVIQEGWREKLEKKILENPGVNNLYYILNYVIDEKGNVLLRQVVGKIHSRNGWEWNYPIHEILEYVGTDPIIDIACEDVIINHHPDYTKDRKRANIWTEVEKNWLDRPRMVYYLAREYYYDKEYDKAIFYYKKFLQMTEIDPSLKEYKEVSYEKGGIDFVTGDPQLDFGAICQYRSSSCLTIAKMMIEKGINPLPWTLRAAGEAFHIREPWYWLGQAFGINGDEEIGKHILMKCLTFNNKNETLSAEGIAWDDNHIIEIIKGVEEKYKEK